MLLSNVFSLASTSSKVLGSAHQMLLSGKAQLDTVPAVKVSTANSSFDLVVLVGWILCLQSRYQQPLVALI